MPRIASKIKLTEKEKLDLEKTANQRTASIQSIERAKIILLAEEGKENQEIAYILKKRPNTIGKWRNRFIESRIDGLKDSSRARSPKKYDEKFKNKIFEVLETKPPIGIAHWDGKEIAKVLKCPANAVWAILRKEGIQLSRKRSWCVSTDPEFAKKSADIVGLYLNPPENALIMSIDEKPSIQAIERQIGYIKCSNGKVIKAFKSTYKRNGTINLFAALNVLTGKVKGKNTKTKKREDFLEFMDEVVAESPTGKELHVILDNYCTHKKNDEWLKKNPHVQFHYTPTSASWLNQVEIWFGILSRKTLKNGSFQSTGELGEAIKAFIERHNEEALPFKWRKREVKGSQIKNTIANLYN